MTTSLEQKKRIACAELDELPHYATSLDAIVPVVIKWCDNNDKWGDFITCVKEQRKMAIYEHLSIRDIMILTPSQIRDALLLAAGKMPK